MSPSGETLRERRRRETRAEIHTTALRLASELGFDKITVEMISTEAGVSSRTFFNYFPNKEEAVVFGPSVLSRPVVDEFVALGPAHPRDVLGDLSGLLARDFAEAEPKRDAMHTVLALAHDNPTIHAAMLARLDRFQRSVAEAVAERLGHSPDDDVPSLIAALGLAAMRVGLQRWSDDGSPDRDESAVPYVQRSARLLQTLLTT